VSKGLVNMMVRTAYTDDGYALDAVGEARGLVFGVFLGHLAVMSSLACRVWFSGLLR
jgi:hypothetical protein